MLEIKVTQLSWINDQVDDQEDQCAHGKIELLLDDVPVFSTEDIVITVSATALFLLRTIEDDHLPDNSVTDGNWLFPCCAFSVWPSEGRYPVVCMGCPTGVDIFVRHEGSEVVLSQGDESVRLSQLAWRKAVLDYVVQIETFYKECTPKLLPKNELDREGWRLFWSEWAEWKQRAT